jgi:hypothetical protein
LRAAQDRRVDDRIGARVVEEAGDGRRLSQVGRQSPGAGGGWTLAVCGRHVEAEFLQQGRETSSKQAARTGDQDAQ